MGLKIDNAGFAEMYKNLLELEKRTTQKRVLQKALVEAAQPMAATAAANAPVENGQLKKSIGVGTKLSARGRKASPPAPDAKYRVNVYVGANSDQAPAAALVEFGTRERVQKTTGRSTGQAHPEPFLRPAFEAEVKGVIDRIAETAKGMIAKAVTRQNNRKAKRG